MRMERLPRVCPIPVTACQGAQDADLYTLRTDAFCNEARQDIANARAQGRDTHRPGYVEARAQ